MPLDYTKPAPNPTSNSPNVGLPCPPPLLPRLWNNSTLLPIAVVIIQMWGRLCLIHPPPSLASATPWKKGEIHTAMECVKASFSIFSNISAFNVCCSTHATLRVLGKKGKIQREECVRVLAFQCQNFPFNEYLFPTAYHLRNGRIFFHIFWNITSGFLSRRNCDSCPDVLTTLTP